MAKRKAESSLLGNKLQRRAVEVLVEELKTSSPKDQEATLSTLKGIFDNIIQYPNDEKYHQIKLTNKLFISKVWCYKAAEGLMILAGWEEDSDCVRLKDASDAEVMAGLLELELQKIREQSPHISELSALATCNRPRLHENENDTNASSSSKCCVLTTGKGYSIVYAILRGDGELLQDILKPYHPACIQNMETFVGFSIAEFACFNRKIGLARILTNEYRVDFSISNEGEAPLWVWLFDGCDSTESCQSLIVQFIKEFKMDVHRLHVMTVLHLAVLHKFFIVVKCLVEDCKVDVNCVSHSVAKATPLHMAYGIGEESIAQYLIEHGANQDALDSDGTKPIDYKLYFNPRKRYVIASQFVIKRRMIRQDLFSREHAYFSELVEQGHDEGEAILLTFDNFFPSLQESLDGDNTNQQYPEPTPMPKELNRYIIDMAPSYHDIGLELDIPYATLKLIRCDPSLPDLKKKCQAMLEVWLENNTSATWKKLCDALKEVGMSALAEKIKNSL